MRSSLAATAIAISVSILLPATSADAQMSPEESLRQLRDADRDRAEPTDQGEASDRDPSNGEPDPTNYQWQLCVRQLKPFFVKVGDEYFCNTHYSTRYGREGRRAVGKPQVRTRKDIGVTLGVHYDYRLKPDGTRSNSYKKQLVRSSLRFEMPAEEVFARRQAIGRPVPGEFGFIQWGQVSSVIDEDSLVLTGITIVDAQAVQSSLSDARSSASQWGYATEDRLEAEARRRTASVRYPDRFEEDVPDASELSMLYRKVIDWQFEGRIAASADEREWRGKKLIVHGVSTAGARPGDRWDGRRQQLVIVGRKDGDTLIAVGNQVFRQRFDEQEVLRVVQSHGLTREQVVDASNIIKRKSVPGNAPSRRLALWVVGRPIDADLDTLPQRSPNDVARVSDPDEQPAPESQLLHEVFESMPNDAIAGPDRPLDDLLAARATDWWRKNAAGRNLRAMAVLTEAYRVDRDDVDDDQTLAPRSATAYGLFAPLPADTDFVLRRTLPPIRVRECNYYVTLIVFVDKEQEAKLAQIPVYRAGQKPHVVPINGTVIGAQFSEVGSVKIYIKDCKLD